MICDKCKAVNDCSYKVEMFIRGNSADCSIYQPTTNFERIKAMSVEEMAEFIANDRKRIIEPMVNMFKIFKLDKICDIAKENIKEWLETEVKE